MNESRAAKRYLSGSVAANDPVTREIFRLECTWAGSPPRAGQFFMLKPKRSSVFLGRPISATGLTTDNNLVFLVARRGAGTEELADLRAGEELYLTGPLGNAWEDFLPKDGTIALVGGGIGIAPLAALAAELSPASFDVYAGFKKTLSDGECAALLGPALRGGKLTLAFEDGAEGVGGTQQQHAPRVDELRPRSVAPENAAGIDKSASALAEAAGAAPRRRGKRKNKRREERASLLARFDRSAVLERGGRLSPLLYYGRIPDFFDPSPYIAVCACGPEAMLAAVSASCRASGVPCYVSLERRMACGAGACLGCTVETAHGNRRCCADGPIFPAEEVFFVRPVR